MSSIPNAFGYDMNYFVDGYRMPFYMRSTGAFVILLHIGREPSL
jgi:hypothetical protein